MERGIVVNPGFAKNLLIGAATLLAALIIYGFAEANTPKLRLFKEKNGDISVELIHKPLIENRWIIITGRNSSENIPYYTNSTSQSDGEKCAVVHRWKWQNIPKIGVLSAEVRLLDAQEKQLEWAQAKIVMGPMEEQ